MKKIGITLSLIVGSLTAWSQTNTFPPSGNVGIGTTSPSASLTIKSVSQYSDGGLRLLSMNSNDFIAYLTGSDAASLGLFDRNSTKSVMIKSNGNSYMTGGYLGIGLDNPSSPITIKSTSQYSDGGLRIISKNSTDFIAFLAGENSGVLGLVNPGSQSTILSANGDSHIMGGNVGIGTTTPQSKLAVNGQIRATEVKVLAAINVPDYVFELDYELRTLKETKEYITEYKHLPEIPSSAEIGENGIDLGDMNMRLLKKIEELTLYQIELLERLEQLESKNAEIDELKKEIDLLKNK